MTPLETVSSLYGHDLAMHQQAIEAQAYEIGAERFLKGLAGKAERGEGADTLVARPLLADLTPKVSAAITEWLEGVHKGKAAHKASAAPLLRMIEPDRAAYIAIRVIMNALTAGHKANEQVTTIQAVSMTLGKDIEDEVRFGAIRDSNAKHFKNVIAPNLAKRSGEHFKRAYMRAVETALQDQDKAPEWDGWDNVALAGVGLKLIDIVMASTGLVELVTLHKGSRTMMKTVLQITEQYSDWLADRTLTLSGLVPVHAPCVVPPKPWVTSHGGGYWFNDSRKPLMLVRGSVKRNQRYKEIDLTQVLRALNAIQNTPWRINAKVLEVAKQVAAMPHPVIKKMPATSKLPKPDKDPLINYESDEAALKVWKHKAAQQYRKEKSRQSRRYQLDFALEHAAQFVEYERIWFPHSLDFRGRIYAATKFSPQGNDMDKGMLLLADAPEMGPDGGYWLKMHGANVAGMDKAMLDDRIKWVDDNHAMIMDIADNPMDNLWWAREADSPFCFLAFCFEYAAWKRQGDTYRCGLAIAFDGSCSGIQHFSAMLKDEVGGAAVNLIPSEKPSDIYRIVSDKVNLILDEHIKEGTPDYTEEKTDKETGEITTLSKRGTHSLATHWRAYGVDRGVTKRSVMTLPYGSKQFGFAEQLLSDIIIPACLERGEGVFPAAREAATYMAKLIWDSLGTTVVAAVKAMDWLQKVAGVLTKENMPCHWVTPVGFPVWQTYKKADVHRIDTVINGSVRITMSVAKHASQDGPSELDRHKQQNGISPNFVHSMDASHLMLTVLEAQAHGVEHFATIHDSFGTCPGLAGVMFKAVRECMVRTYSDRDVIQDFFNTFESLLSEENRGNIPAFPPKGKLDLGLIRSSLYCFA